MGKLDILLDSIAFSPKERHLALIDYVGAATAFLALDGETHHRPCDVHRRRLSHHRLRPRVPPLLKSGTQLSEYTVQEHGCSVERHTFDMEAAVDVQDFAGHGTRVIAGEQ